MKKAFEIVSVRNSFFSEDPRYPITLNNLIKGDVIIVQIIRIL